MSMWIYVCTLVLSTHLISATKKCAISGTTSRIALLCTHCLLNKLFIVASKVFLEPHKHTKAKLTAANLEQCFVALIINFRNRIHRLVSFFFSFNLIIVVKNLYQVCQCLKAFRLKTISCQLSQKKFFFFRSKFRVVGSAVSGSS